MKMQAIVTVTFLTLSLISVAGMAGSDLHGKGRFMSLFDTNSDDVVTMDEFRAAAAERFKAIDSDNSGTVSKEEFRSYIKAKRQKRNERKFKTLDVDGNGDISQQEYLDYKLKKAERRFQRMDKDGNGIVSKDEFSKKRRHSKRYGKHGKGGIFAKLDKNSNGVITRDESLAAWTDWFTRIDGNGDQVVTVEEVREYRLRKFESKQ